MFEVRQILLRMRQGDSDRVLSRSGLVGRRKAADIRCIAKANNWLDTSIPLPGNKVLSQSPVIFKIVRQSRPAWAISPVLNPIGSK